MRKLWVSSLVLTIVSAAAAAQSIHAIGVHDAVWANNSGAGTPNLEVRLHYPAVTAGTDTPVLFHENGWPTVVVLHGYSLLGYHYVFIANALAEAGFIAVLLNTAQFSSIDMENDARALFEAIDVANNTPGSLEEGTFDTDNVGLFGHSMGGSVMAHVLADNPGNAQHNPGYRCGLLIAPDDPGAVAADVHVPMGLISGEGDLLTPVALHAIPYYTRLAPLTGMKFHYRMDSHCGHFNAAGIGTGTVSPQVFERAKRIATGFFAQFLGGDWRGLEGVCGPNALNDPLLVGFDREVVTPQIWANSGLQVGQSTRISLLGEAGLGGLWAASNMSVMPTSTAFGELLLDPSSTYPLVERGLESQRLDLPVIVPNLPALVGSTFALQGIATSSVSPYVLGSALQFVIE